MLRDVFYYGEKPNVHPREKFAIDLLDARSQSTTEHFWIINEFCDYRGFDWDFDFEFLPDEDVWAQEHNNVWPSQHQKDSGTWLCPKEHSDYIIYRGDVNPVKRKNIKTNHWVLLDKIDESKFDFSWHPDPTDPPFIYKWGCKFFPAELKHVLEYRADNAIQEKYMTTVVELLPNYDYIVEVQKIDQNKFDISWRPDPLDSPYIYVWGNKYIDGRLKPTLEYHTPGATEKKYMPELLAVLPETDRWVEYVKVNTSTFDLSWRPDPREPDYNYVWGNKYEAAEIKPTIEYRMPGATQTKYMSDVVDVLPEWDRWDIPETIDKTNFDFSWRPDPREPPFIYQFGTQWQTNGGPKYTVPSATDIKYIDTIKAERLASKTNWYLPVGLDVSNFDFSWHPDDTAPKYIYQFGTILDDVHLKDGPKYITPDNNGEIVYLENVFIIGNLEYPKYTITTSLENLIKEHPNKIFWAIRENIDYTNFDFSWRPTKEQAFNINVFGSAESELTQTYFVNATFYNQGYTERTFIEDKKIEEINLSELFVKPSMFYVDRSNIESQQRFEELKQRFPDIQKTRYLNSWVDTINRCINRSSTELCWILNSELDYSDFDFNYYPNPWQMKMVHVFGTQWSHWGTTFLINRDSFSNDTKYVKIIEHLNNLNFIKDKNKRAKATNCLYDVFVISHGNKELNNVLELLHDKVKDKNINVVDYKDDYLSTFKNILSQLSEKKEHYIWICSSICDYEMFDFTYICDPFAKEQLHVFPSGQQKFGDTFLVNINRLRQLINDMDLLTDYEKINFNRHLTAHRYPAPEIITYGDTHTSSIDIDFDYPYAIFTTEDNKDVDKIFHDPVNLWSNEVKNIIITSTGGTRIIVPKEAKSFIKKQFYDYPYIIKHERLSKSKPLDIVFLSNGEPGADENYEHLLNVTKKLKNRIVRVDGVNGRVAAYHAAAEASLTPWMFTVFAKLKVSNDFDWDWQPDRLQVPKHVVFHAKNPLNNLVYGHQAMIAYNKKLTLANIGKGLDFTLDDEHEVVDIMSGIAKFNVDEWTTWRTAFRECIKLCTFADIVSQERLKIWTTIAEGNYAQYCLDGANDAVSYFSQVNGNFEKLKLSYDWAWLQDKFNLRYK